MNHRAKLTNTQTRRLDSLGNVIRTVVAIFTFSCAAPTQAEEIDLPRLVKNARPAVVLLTVFDSAGQVAATGTGFFVSTDGKLITNWHVAEDAHAIEAKGESGVTYTVSGVLAASPKEDLALLQAEASAVPALPIGRTASVEIGSKVAVIGSPLGLEGSLSDGIVSAKRKLGGDDAWFQVTAPISPGSSGSPVFNAKGEVIGVATMHLRGSQALNFASPSDAVIRLLEKAALSQPTRSFSEVRRAVAEEIWSDANVKAALDAVQNGDYTEALTKVSAAVKMHPKREEVWHVQGAIFANLEFWKDAINSLKRANELNPEMAENWYDLGVCQVELGEIDAAIESLQAAIKLKPKYFKAWDELGECHKKQSKWANAELAFRQASKIDPQDAETTYKLGWCLKNQERLSEAMEFYKRASELAPDHPRIWNSMAYVHLVQQRPSDAVSALRKAVELDPAMDEAWNNLATAAGMQGDWATVRTAVDKLRDLNSPAYAEALKLLRLGEAAKAPKDPKAKEAQEFFAKAEALFKSGELDKAIAAFRQAVKRQPKNANYWYWLGMTHGRKGEGKDAFNCFSETVKLDPSHADGWRNLGVAYREQGRFKDAKNAAEQAIRLDPSHALAWNDLGVLIMEFGNAQQAVQCFQAAVNSLSSYEVGWRNLGIAYCRMGNESEARQVLAEMRQRNNSLASELAEAIETLQSPKTARDLPTTRKRR